METWEYRTFSLFFAEDSYEAEMAMEDCLNRKGTEGWEIVSVVPHRWIYAQPDHVDSCTSAHVNQYRVFCKRRMQSSG